MSAPTLSRAANVSGADERRDLPPRLGAPAPTHPPRSVPALDPEVRLMQKQIKGKSDAHEILAETKKDVEELTRDAKAREAELQSELTKEGTDKERLDAKLAADRVQEPRMP